MIIAYAKQDFICTLQMSFANLWYLTPVILFVWNPKTDLLPIPELRWAAAMSSHPDACFSPLPPSFPEIECLDLVPCLEA